jgi:hypothetical protein
VPLHFACKLSGIHFAIHPAVCARFDARKVQATPPTDHGFALVDSFGDPDVKKVQIMQIPTA